MTDFGAEPQQSCHRDFLQTARRRHYIPRQPSRQLVCQAEHHPIQSRGTSKPKNHFIVFKRRFRSTRKSWRAARCSACPDTTPKKSSSLVCSPALRMRSRVLVRISFCNVQAYSFTDTQTSASSSPRRVQRPCSAIQRLPCTQTTPDILCVSPSSLFPTN